VSISPLTKEIPPPLASSAPISMPLLRRFVPSPSSIKCAHYLKEEDATCLKFGDIGIDDVIWGRKFFLNNLGKKVVQERVGQSQPQPVH
jgi:hypothetical protein